MADNKVVINLTEMADSLGISVTVLLDSFVQTDEGKIPANFGSQGEWEDLCKSHIRDVNTDREEFALDFVRLAAFFVEDADGTPLKHQHSKRKK